MKHSLGQALSAKRQHRRRRALWLALVALVCVGAACYVAWVATGPTRHAGSRVREFRQAQRVILAEANEDPYSRPDVAPYYEIIRTLSDAQVRELVKTGELSVQGLTMAQRSLWVSSLERVPDNVRRLKGYREPLRIRYLAPGHQWRTKPAVTFDHLPYDDGPPRGWEMGLVTMPREGTVQ